MHSVTAAALYLAAYLVAFCILAPPALGQQTAGAIMQRVARNQDRAEELRSSFIYEQTVRVRLLRGGGKLAREEQREYTVTPTPGGFERQLTAFSGRYRRGRKLIDYSEPGYTTKKVDIDAEVASDLAEEIGSDKSSKDGLDPDLFPLATREQRKYRFALAGTTRYRDREVFEITFEPKDNEIGWAGEVLVDTGEFQPGVITTHLSKGIPLLVKIAFGINVQHLGFKLTYDRFADGVWFPVTYGGEFKFRGLFFYARTVVLSLHNHGFRRADVSSDVTFHDVSSEVTFPDPEADTPQPAPDP